MADTADSPSRIPIRANSPEETRAKSKRRSLLLQPGTLVAAQRQASGNGQARQRPMTMFNPDLSSLADLATQFGGDSAQESPQEDNDMASDSDALAKLEGRSSKPPTRPNKIPSTPSTAAKPGLSRSQSLRKPTIATDTTRTLLAPNRSSTFRSARPLSTLVESTSTRSFRPDSSISTSSNESHPAPTASRLKTPSASTTTSAPSLRRVATTSTRPGAPNGRLQSALPTPSSVQSTPAPKLEPAQPREEPSRTQRSGFTTYQQHYSPLKHPRPKPLSTSLTRVAPPDASSSLGLDAQILQIQLLQLSILHRDAAVVERAWDESARRRLEGRFAEIVRRAEKVQEKEKEGVGRRNLEALREWGAVAEEAFAENVRTLAGVVGNASLLGEEGGRVYRVFGLFERWIGEVEGLWERRADGQGTATRASVFVDDLGESWRVEVASLIRRLGILERALASLPPAKEGSSLADVIRVFGELVSGMKAELGVVQGIEEAVVEGERRWVDRALEGIDWGFETEVG